MPEWLAPPLGFGLGLAMGLLQLLWLRYAINKATSLAARSAARRVAGGAPLRVLAWVPALLVAAHWGLFACLALVAGLMVSRFFIWHHISLRRPSTVTPETQG